MAKHTYKKWTQADDAELVLMREARVPVKEIAKTLKRTPSAVANRVIVLGIPMGKGPNKQRIEMMKARDHMGRWSLGQVPESKTKLKPEWWKAMMWWRK
jgi:hypothetical protein